MPRFWARYSEIKRLSCAHAFVRYLLLFILQKWRSNMKSLKKMLTVGWAWADWYVLFLAVFIAGCGRICIRFLFRLQPLLASSFKEVQKLVFALLFRRQFFAARDVVVTVAVARTQTTGRSIQAAIYRRACGSKVTTARKFGLIVARLFWDRQTLEDDRLSSSQRTRWALAGVSVGQRWTNTPWGRDRLIIGLSQLPNKAKASKYLFTTFHKVRETAHYSLVIALFVIARFE